MNKKFLGKIGISLLVIFLITACNNLEKTEVKTNKEQTTKDERTAKGQKTS